MRPLKLLILGGSSEASELARALARDSRYEAALSLAGRTGQPGRSPIPMRKGGFGGVTGLARALAEEAVDVLIDATHPFAVRIKRNAIEAAREVGLPLLAIRRPPWQAQEGDQWIAAADMEKAAAALGKEPKRVFLTVGRQALAPFARAPQHLYVVRSVEAPPIDVLPPQARVITARGPFSFADEVKLLRDNAIQIIVTKNSGGTATAAKLEAARALNLPVVMVSRPELPDASDSVATVGEALVWLERHHDTIASA